MMKSFVGSVAVLLALSNSRLLVADAACLGNCSEVNANAQCLGAFQLAFSGDIKNATRALVYGRYCGNNNECDAVDSIPQGEEDSYCLASDTDNCQPDACDPIDEACKVQDQCLDAARAAANGTELA